MMTLVLILGAIIGTFWIRRDIRRTKIKEDKERRDKEFEEIMNQADQNIKDLREIGDWMFQTAKENLELKDMLLEKELYSEERSEENELGL